MSDPESASDSSDMFDFSRANAALELLSSDPSTAQLRDALLQLGKVNQKATAVQIVGLVGLVGSGAAHLISRAVANADRSNAGPFKTRLLELIEDADRLADEAIPTLVSAMKAAQEWKSGVEPHLRDLPQRHLPPNLRDIPGIDISRVLDFLRTDGIPLYLIPRQSIATSLLKARDHAGVRDLLSSRFGVITADCEALLGASRTAATSEVVDFAAEGIAALKAGHVAAAQALFSVTLDSLVWSLPESERLAVAKHRRGSDPERIEQRELQFALAFTPVWTAHEAFRPNENDPIPRDFSRHASLHRVSRRQYSKRNALQALMLLSSVVGYTAAGST